MNDLISRQDAIDEMESKNNVITEDDYLYCEDCDHIEMCRWYPLYGCEFRSLPPAEPSILDDGTLTITVKYGMLSKVNRVIVDEAGTKFCKVMYQDALPSVERVGHWIERDDGFGDIYYECSVCKEAFALIEGTPMDNLYYFCPNCGADMRGENNEQT